VENSSQRRNEIWITPSRYELVARKNIKKEITCKEEN